MTEQPIKSQRSPLFRSFWMGGFEGASHINGSGNRLDMVAATQHDTQVDHDYQLLREMGIFVARESVRWHLIEQYGKFDFSTLLPFLKAASDHGIQINWTVCHYGWPDDLDIFSPAFITRFSRFCTELASFIAEHSNSIPFYSLINEISFMTWAVCHSDIMYPYAIHGKGRDSEFKQQLVKAVIAGCDAIWSVDPLARFIHVDPIIHIIPDRPDLAEAAEAQRLSQYEAWDMLSGAAEPHLGGDPKYLDIIGVNYYHSNQWEFLSKDRLHWHLNDPRRIALSQLLNEVWNRYKVPIIIGETSHVGVGRGQWIKEIAHEVRIAIKMGVPIEGICLYPIIDRHDWENPHHWHNSGLWDLTPDETGFLKRKINQPYSNAFREAQRMLVEEGVIAQH